MHSSSISRTVLHRFCPLVSLAWDSCIFGILGQFFEVWVSVSSAQCWYFVYLALRCVRIADIGPAICAYCCHDYSVGMVKVKQDVFEEFGNFR
jgi:hypothetical protein